MKMISLETAIDAIAAYAKRLKKEKYHAGAKVTREIIKILTELSGYEWIPCGERLPEEQGFYLVTVCAEYRPVRIYCFSPCGIYEEKKYWKNDCDDHAYVFNHFVEAWMPLPEFFQKKEDLV